MRYADNQPVKECRDCIQAIVARKCHGCEAKTLQMFIVWIGTAIGLLSALVLVLLATTYQAKADVVVLTNEGYTSWFDTDLRIPVCVEYDLEPQEVVRMKRVPHDFIGDPRIPITYLNRFSYERSGYDRGHMAPAADFNWSTNALKETYYFSNICPQAPQLNRGKWLEAEAETRRMAESGTVHVVIVAIPGTNWLGAVNIPSAFLRTAVGPFGIRHWRYENR